MTVELPRCLAAEWTSLAAIAAAGVVVEAVMARHPGASAGFGVVLAALLASWAWRGWRNRPATLEVGGSRVGLRFADGRRCEAVPAAGTRLLGCTVVLRWRRNGRPGGVWLTPVDLPRHELRALAVLLVARSRGPEPYGDRQRAP